MAAKGDRLTTNQFLHVDDYLVSNNRCYFAILQGDGNFVVYRGSGPDDNQGVLWASATAARYSVADGDYSLYMRFDGNLVCFRGHNTNDIVWASASLTPYPLQGGVNYVAIMQDDSNFVVYKETNPGSAPWATSAMDPITDFEAENIQYDLEAAKTVSSSPQGIYSNTVHNRVDREETSHISETKSVAQTSGWTTTVGTKVTTSYSLKTSIPEVADETISVSAEVSESYSWNESTTRTKQESFTLDLVVPPHKSYKVVAWVTVTTIEVPYMLYGTAILKSGTRLPGRSISGVYKGSNSHNVEATYVDIGDPTAAPRPLAAGRG